MQMPEVLRGNSGKRLLQGAIVGAVATTVVGFGWGGWTLGSNAKQMALAANEAGKVEALAPLCVAKFKEIDGALAKFQAAPSYNRDTLIHNSVKTIGTTQMSWPLARECQKRLETQLTKSASAAQKS